MFKPQCVRSHKANTKKAAIPICRFMSSWHAIPLQAIIKEGDSTVHYRPLDCISVKSDKVVNGGRSTFTCY